MRKGICILIALCLLSIPPVASASTPVDLEESLATSPAVQELQEIMRGLAARAALADSVELEKAYRSSDVERITELLGLTAEDYLAIDARLAELRLALETEFPEIKRRAGYMAPGSCGFSPSFAQCHVRRALNRPEAISLVDGPVEENQDVACEWGQYSAALVLCTLAGPYFYWPCAYLALCSYCSGGWVDNSCF